MLSKIRSFGTQNTKFYVPANIKVVQSGYMYKSPPQTFFRSSKSWKRRYFVLSRTTTNHYELRFFKDENKQEKPLGQINLYQVSLLYRHTESHPMWLWILKNFKCSASCVIYIRVPERDYFLVGENSCEMDDWFNAIFKAVNTRPQLEENQETRTCRSISEPPSLLHPNQKQAEDQEQAEIKEKKEMRQSAPETFNIQHSQLYDYPRNYRQASLPIPLDFQENEDTEEEEEEEMKTNKESDGHYMDMSSVKEMLRQSWTEDIFYSQTILEGNGDSENSFLQSGKEGNEDGVSGALNCSVSPQSETIAPAEKEICVSQFELKNSVIFSEEGGRICVSNKRHTPLSSLFHEGDQIVAINDLYTENLGELNTYLRRISKDQVRLTILRQPGSRPLGGSCT